MERKEGNKSLVLLGVTVYAALSAILVWVLNIRVAELIGAFFISTLMLCFTPFIFRGGFNKCAISLVLITPQLCLFFSQVLSRDSIVYGSALSIYSEGIQLLSQGWRSTLSELVRGGFSERANDIKVQITFVYVGGWIVLPLAFIAKANLLKADLSVKEQFGWIISLTLFLIYSMFFMNVSSEHCRVRCIDFETSSGLYLNLLGGALSLVSLLTGVALKLIISQYMTWRIYAVK